ncbi:10817_t:CDS:1, partial [Acaulospora morrowiae]
DYDGKQFHFLPIDVDESTEYGTGEYILRLHGILTNGRKLRVDVCGIKPFFDILVDEIDANQLVSEIEYDSYELIQAKPIMSFYVDMRRFFRFYFKNHIIRLEQLRRVKDRYLTYSNDLTFHYRKITRECELDVTQWQVVNSSGLIYGDNKYRKVLRVYRDQIVE